MYDATPRNYNAMDIYTSQDLVFTLDAGGTNLAFAAMQAAKLLGKSFVISAKSDNLPDFLNKLVEGFSHLQKLYGQPQAISFAFPGPADYPKGIIGDLENLPIFRGGVPLSDFLKQYFQCPVFINNDGDLFTLGEAIGGFLPYINHTITQKGNRSPFRSLMGITLGTGLGGGIVYHGQLLEGENSASGEINRMGNPFLTNTSMEDSLSIRAIKRHYAQATQLAMSDSPEPYEIYKIATGETPGNKNAALASFTTFGKALAEVLANMISMFDAPVVIGGGLSGAYSLFLDTAITTLQKQFVSIDDKHPFSRLEVDVYNAHNTASLDTFLQSQTVALHLEGLTTPIMYQPHKAVVVGISQLGTEQAVALGAYAYAIEQIS